MLFILLDLNQASKCGGKRRLAIKIAIGDTTSWSSNFLGKRSLRLGVTPPTVASRGTHCQAMPHFFRKGTLGTLLRQSPRGDKPRGYSGLQNDNRLPSQISILY